MTQMLIPPVCEFLITVRSLIYDFITCSFIMKTAYVIIN